MAFSSWEKFRHIQAVQMNDEPGFTLEPLNLTLVNVKDGKGKIRSVTPIAQSRKWTAPVCFGHQFYIA